MHSDQDGDSTDTVPLLDLSRAELGRGRGRDTDDDDEDDLDDIDVDATELHLGPRHSPAYTRVTVVAPLLAVLVLLAIVAWRSPFISSSSSAAAVKDKVARVRVLNQQLAENYDIDDLRSGRRYNAPALERLANCMEDRSCGSGEERVVLLASFHFGNAKAGLIGGEDIWANSTMNAFESLNYTMLFSYGHMDTLLIYQAIPDLVKIVLWEGETLRKCAERNETNYLALQEDSAPGKDWQEGQKGCIKTESYPSGIPWWKSFAFHFWAETLTPLGYEWTLGPEDYATFGPQHVGNQYLGYTIEDRCLAERMFNTSEREHRGLILGKLILQLEEQYNQFYHLLEPVARAMPAGIDPSTGHSVPFGFISTAGKSAEEKGPEPLPEPGVLSLGKMRQHEWTETLAKSKVLLGLGYPTASPSPYDALCLGVPFINPILSWSESDPDNRELWDSQQNALKYLDPPYVYQVRHGDEKGLADAVLAAITSPIDRFVPERMTTKAVRERHRLLVESDWLSRAQAYVKEHYDGDFVL